jgi:hypothetical protein
MNRRAPYLGPLAIAAALGVAPASLGSQTPLPPLHRDCQVYNPDTLTIERLDTGVWRLQDGGMWMAGFATEAEGKNALALAQRFREMCFIGRMNRRPLAERGDYILYYWQGPSGKQTTIDPEQCQAYDPGKLHIADKGSVGWVVTDDAGLTLTLGSEDDATAALALAKEHKARCSIGKYVNRPGQPRTSRVDYWK